MAAEAVCPLWTDLASVALFGALALGALWAIVWFTARLFLAALNYTRKTGAFDDATTVILRDPDAAGAFEDRHGDVWARLVDLPQISHQRASADRLGRVVGNVYPSAIHQTLKAATVAGHAEDDTCTIVWKDPDRQVEISLHFAGDTVTASRTPSHIDYPDTKVFVGDVLARCVWPYLAKDDPDAERRSAVYAAAFGPVSKAMQDPFLARTVSVSTDIVDRLRGRYASGPHFPNGEPEFGWRQFQATPINNEAADVILEQRRIIAEQEAEITRLTQGLKDAETEADDRPLF